MDRAVCPFSGELLTQDTSHRELSIGLLGAFCAIALHSLTDFNLYIPANALAVAWLGGLAISPILRTTSAESDRRNAFAEEEWNIEAQQEATTSLQSIARAVERATPAADRPRIPETAR